MGEWRRLFYYLLLNVLVSAVTTLAVLIVWDKLQLSSNDFSAVLPVTMETPAVTIPAEKTLSPQAPVGTQAAQNEAVQITPTAPEADLPAVAPTAEDTPAQTANGEAPLIIENVIGAGDLGTEKIFVKRVSGEGPLSLANWRIRGAKGEDYIFPQISLYNPGAVYIHSMAGADTPRDLYWGRSEAAWSSGAEVTLTDDQGRIQATYKIP